MADFNNEATRFGDSIPQLLIDSIVSKIQVVRYPRFAIRFDRVESNSPDGPLVLLCDGKSNARVIELQKILFALLRRAQHQPKPSRTPHMTIHYAASSSTIGRQTTPMVEWQALDFALILSHVGKTHHQVIRKWSLEEFTPRNNKTPCIFR